MGKDRNSDFEFETPDEASPDPSRVGQPPINIGF
jgi:hypothetical protein